MKFSDWLFLFKMKQCISDYCSCDRSPVLALCLDKLFISCGFARDFSYELHCPSNIRELKLQLHEKCMNEDLRVIFFLSELEHENLANKTRWTVSVCLYYFILHQTLDVHTLFVHCQSFSSIALKSRYCSDDVVLFFMCFHAENRKCAP